MSKYTKTIIISCTAILSIATGALARTVNYHGKVETVTVTLGSPTLIRFEKPVKTVSNAAQFVIHTASEDNPDYAVLAVEARSAKAANFATFILADGTFVRTKLISVPASGETGDNIYDIKTGELGGAGSGDSSPLEVKAMDLMKAMVRGDKVMGYEVRDSHKVLLTGALGVQAELSKLYVGSDFNGYMIRVTNKSEDKKYRVDIRSLRIGEPNLAVLTQIDRDVLGTSGSSTDTAYLRVVAKPGAVYRDVVLPIAPVKPEKGGSL